MAAGDVNPYTKAIQGVKASVPVVRTGTCQSSANPVTGAVTVSLDNDPQNTPVTAISAADLLGVGVRVVLLAYPPQGLLVVGRLDSNGAFTSLTTTGSIAAGSGITAGGGITVGGFLVANAGILSTAMRATAGFDAAGFSVFSTSFITSVAAAFTFPFPPSGTIVVSTSANHVTNTLAGERALLTPQVRVTNAAGAIVHGSQESEAGEWASATAGLNGGLSRTIIMTGLPTSGTGYIEPCGRSTNAASTAAFNNIRIVVQPSL